jgi:hypothetical protein
MLGDIELDGGPTSALGQKRTWAGGVAGGDFIPRGGSAYEAIADVTVWRRVGRLPVCSGGNRHVREIGKGYLLGCLRRCAVNVWTCGFGLVHGTAVGRFGSHRQFGADRHDRLGDWHRMPVRPR